MDSPVLARFLLLLLEKDIGELARAFLKAVVASHALGAAYSSRVENAENSRPSSASTKVLSAAATDAVSGRSPPLREDSKSTTQEAVLESERASLATAATRGASAIADASSADSLYSAGSSATLEREREKVCASGRAHRDYRVLHDHRVRRDYRVHHVRRVRVNHVRRVRVHHVHRVRHARHARHVRRDRGDDDDDAAVASDGCASVGDDVEGDVDVDYGDSCDSCAEVGDGSCKAVVRDGRALPDRGSLVCVAVEMGGAVGTTNDVACCDACVCLEMVVDYSFLLENSSHHRCLVFSAGSVVVQATVVSELAAILRLVGLRYA